MFDGLSDLWRWRGSVGRGTYAAVGVVGFTLKHNLDRWVAGWVFDRPWGIFNYWVSPFGDLSWRALLATEGRFLFTMLVLALPFIWVGVALTMRRLRSAALPSSLVVGPAL